MIFSVVTFFSLFVSIWASVPIEDGVYVLSDSNFEEFVDAGATLVEFYAPWCGHCKKLAPEYSKAAGALEGEAVRLAKVDCTVETGLAEKFGIQGFPTLKFFKNGSAKPIDYQGGRTSGEIVSYLKKQTGPAAKTVNTDAELASLQESNDVVVLGFFNDATSANAKAFLELAGKADDALFYAISSSDAVKTKLGLTGEAVVLLKSFDDLRVDLAISTFDEVVVSDFIVSNSSPLVQEFSQETSKKIFSSPITKHALFFTDKKADHHAPLVNSFKDVAKNFKGSLLAVNVPSTENRVLDYFGIKSDNLPAFVAVDMSSKSIKKYPYAGDLTSSSAISTHLSEFLEGKLTPHLKSEDVAADDTTGDVVVLRGKSFNDIVLNNNKDVLVEFYAPWCGHCKKLAPTWDELGAKFNKNDNIVIAKMDATANEIDVDGVSVQGFPTIYFFPGNTKKAVKYEGAREFDDFVEYLKEHASNKFDHSEL